eukprot:scaffold20198_cov160-Isochrysis_galbana.AAC.1
MSSPLTYAPHTDARSPRTARSKNWMIFRKYPTYRLPSAYRWYSVPTKRPEAKQAHAPEIFAIPAEDLREDKKSSQYLPSWDFRLFTPFSLFRPPVAEGWCQSCVHYNSQGWGIESLGFGVGLNPMSASLSTSLRADYG